MFENKDNLSRTIYSICWTETKKILAEMLSLDHSQKFSETWSKKQDAMHLPYLSKWKRVFKKYISFDENVLKFGYPTNGSSESINMNLVYLNSQGYSLVVFNEEYEGYSMVAKNIGMKTYFVSKNNYQEEIKKIENECDKLVMFISQPSSIDGNYWNEFHSYMDYMENSSVKVYVDVTYAGCFEHPQIMLDKYKCLEGVIYSLSKCFGVYYHRIGGCFLKNENPLLWPMLWFKNLMSIQYAIFLLEAFDQNQYLETRNKVKLIQEKIAKDMEKALGLKVIASDVPMIVMVEANFEKYDWLKQYNRGENSEFVRVCISKDVEKELYDN